MKPKNNKISLARPYFDRDEISEIKKVLDSGWVASGPKVREFEASAADYLKVDHAVAVCNCTAALHLSLLSLGIKNGDEVIVPDFTFPATGHAVLYCGAKPIFADVRSDTYNIDPADIERKITARTKAIIPVHAFGNPASMAHIMETAEKRGLCVLEDAACAFGSKYNGSFAGTIGELGCFSFHARKGITTGEGGMIVTNDKKLADDVRFHSVFGMRTAWERSQSKKLSIPSFSALGYNYKMSDIAAAVGVAQLRKVDRICKRKQQLAAYYGKRLSDIDGLHIQTIESNSIHTYQSYVIVLDKLINRNRVIDTMMKNGIQTQIGTYSLHIQPVYRRQSICVNSLNLYQQSLALPFYYELSKVKIDFIVDKLEKAMRGAIHANQR